MFGRTEGTTFRCFIHEKNREKWTPACSDMHVVERKSFVTLYPTEAKSQCTLLQLTNLDQPELVNVHCHKALLSRSICIIPNSSLETQDITRNFLANKDNLQTTCLGDVVLQKRCWHLTWSNCSTRPPHLIAHTGVMELTANRLELSALEKLLSFTSVDLLSVIVCSSQVSTVEKHVLSKHASYLAPQIRFQQESISSSLVEGFLVFVSDFQHNQTRDSSHVFRCRRNDIDISVKWICDGEKDCPDASDEHNCLCLLVKNTTFCQTVRRNDQEKCGPLYYRSRQQKCRLYLARKSETNVSLFPQQIECDKTNRIASEQENDLVPDCEDHRDEPELVALLTKGLKTTCSDNNKIPCKPGHSRCYSFSEICIFRLDRHNNLFPCRNAGHLEDCKENECKSTYKCLNHFCIPWSYVCDKKTDCPNVDDENHLLLCEKYGKCTNMFKCKFSQICLHLDDVCDGETECPLADDETLCNLNHVCPNSCWCLALSILCENRDLTFEEEHFSYLAVKMINLFISNPENILQKFSNCVSFQFIRNNVAQFCSIQYPLKLYEIYAAQNPFEKLTDNCFKKVLDLHLLRLPHNNISEVHSSSLKNLKYLQLLQLSNNPLQQLSLNSTTNLERMKVIILMNTSTPASSLETDLGGAIWAVSDNKHICCQQKEDWDCVGNVLCPKLISCVSFLAIQIALSLLIMVFNIGSVLVHKFLGGLRPAFTVSIYFINATDILLPAYFWVLSIAHINMSENFYMLQDDWLSGMWCFTDAAVLIIFTFASQSCQVLLSIAREMVVIHPFNTKFKQCSFVTKLNAVALLVSTGIGVVLSFTIRITQQNLTFDWCSPFIDTAYSYFIATVTSLYIIVQLMSSITMHIMHFNLVYTLHKQKKNTAAITNKQQKSDAGIIVQLLLISLSCMLCWYPSHIVHALPIILHPFPLQLVMWTYLIVIPIHPLLNPSILFAFAVRRHVQS